MDGKTGNFLSFVLSNAAVNVDSRATYSDYGVEVCPQILVFDPHRRLANPLAHPHDFVRRCRQKAIA